MEGRDALSGEGVQTHGLVSQSDVSRAGQGSVTSAANDGNTPAGHGANISGGGASGSAAGQVHSSPDVNNAGTALNQQVLSTQDLDSGVVYTPSRVEMRHEAIPDLLHSHVIPSQPPAHSARSGPWLGVFKQPWSWARAQGPPLLVSPPPPAAPLQGPPQVKTFPRRAALAEHIPLGRRTVQTWVHEVHGSNHIVSMDSSDFVITRSMLCCDGDCVSGAACHRAELPLPCDHVYRWDTLNLR